ncbi:MAG TPA: 4-hydroxythreonine-4-phosphate dehydrogenase PdxA [Chitinophagales bacterium]|nr:4-hydroxythreonine-4-phosphate dehydrogenase PdxA [Chitinophagales bacterium]
MAAPHKRVKAGITIGDINGIGLEVILKTFNEPKMFDFCIPVLYGNANVVAYHKKHFPTVDKLNLHPIRDFNEINPKNLNIINCWEEEVIINFGQPSQKAGDCALLALDTALNDILAKKIDVLVTAPLNKSTVKPKGKEFTGHTGYITQKCGLNDSLMMLVSERLRVGLVTEHIPIREIAEQANSKKILTKLEIMNHSLKKDFGITGPKIAVLGLNPHSGDSGVIGKEEKEVIAPAVAKAQESGILAFGPYPSDGFFGSALYKKFDAVLAMYHDQGLTPFKAISFDTGVNFTAGLPIIRTSPDHGTAYDIAGKDCANHESFREAVFLAVDVCHHRTEYLEYTAHPLKKREIAQD